MTFRRGDRFQANHRRARRRPTVAGLDLVEFALLVLAGLVTAAAVLLIASSSEAAGATIIVGVLVALGSFRTIRITQQGQITERFTRAIDQLGSEQPSVRLGGLYGLERIARYSRDDHAQIMEVLTAYVAEHAPRPPRPLDGGPSQAPSATTGDGQDKAPARDVQGAIAILGRREERRKEYRLDLSSTDLEGAQFAQGELGNFQRAIFSGARLTRATLRGALLNDADFDRADLEGADLRGAVLYGANLEEADNLDKADLRGAVYDLDSSDATYRGTRWPRGFDFQRAVHEHLTQTGDATCHAGGTRLVWRAPPLSGAVDDDGLLHVKLTVGVELLELRAAPRRGRSCSRWAALARRAPPSNRDTASASGDDRGPHGRDRWQSAGSC